MEKGRICPNCKIEIMGNTIKCPLCNSELEGEKPENHWPEPRYIKKEKKIFKTQLLILLAFAAVCFVYLVAFERKEDSLIRGIILLAWVLLGELLANRIIKTVKTPLAGILQCGIVVLALDIVTAFFYPVMIIGIPFIITGIILFDFVVLLIDQTDSTYGYFIANICIGAISFIFAVFVENAIIDFLWKINIIVCLSTIGVAMIVKGPKIIREIKNKISF